MPQYKSTSYAGARKSRSNFEAFFTGTASRAKSNTIRSTLSARGPHGNRLRCGLTQNYYHQSQLIPNWNSFCWFDWHFMQKHFILIQIKQQLLSQLVEPLQAKLIFNAFWLFPVHVRVKCFDDPKPKSPFSPNQSICIWLSVPKLAFFELVWDLAKFPCMTWKTFTLKLTRITIKHILNSFK